MQYTKVGLQPALQGVCKLWPGGVGICLVLLVVVSVHGAPAQKPKQVKSIAVPLAVAHPASGRRPVDLNKSRQPTIPPRHQAKADPVVRKSRQPQRQPPAAQASAATPASTPGRRERVIQGTIRGSLYKALRTQGGTPQMAHDLVEILTWDVDFQTDVRAGDRFHLLIEERSRHGKFTYHRILAAELGNKQRRVQAVYYPPQEEDGAYYRPNGQSLRRMFLSAPVRYTRISSAFSYSRRHPVLNTYRPHLGIDYAAPTGTPVRSVGDGVITWAGMKGGGGKTVEIRHDGTYSTYYLHLSRIASTVQVGRSVSQGQVIGYVGATGLATGPHLDFRIAKNGTFLNPLTQQDVAAPALARESLAAFRAYSQRLLTKLHASSSGNKE